MKAHFRALHRLGPCPIHRRSFAVVREVLGLPPLPPWPNRSGVDPGVVAANEAAGVDAVRQGAAGMQGAAGVTIQQSE